MLQSDCKALSKDREVKMQEVQSTSCTANWVRGVKLRTPESERKVYRYENKLRKIL